VFAERGDARFMRVRAFGVFYLIKETIK